MKILQWIAVERSISDFCCVVIVSVVIGDQGMCISLGSGCAYSVDIRFKHAESDSVQDIFREILSKKKTLFEPTRFSLYATDNFRLPRIK